MQGHHGLRLLRGDDQRVRGVHEVEGGAHQPVEGGPAQPVPGQVQEVHGQAAVHERDVRRPGALRVPVAQRGGEEEEAVVGGEGGQALGQRQHVGADAGGPRERGADVEGDVHRAAPMIAGQAPVLESPVARAGDGRGYGRRHRIEDRGGGHGVRRPGGGRVPGRERQHRRLRRQGRGQGRRAALRGEIPIYEPGLEEMIAAQRGRGAAAVLRPTSRGGRGERHPLHRRGHAAGRGRLRGHDPRAAGGRGHRQGHERPQDHRQQVDRPGGHRAARVRQVVAGLTTHPFAVVSNPEFLKEARRSTTS